MAASWCASAPSATEYGRLTPPGEPIRRHQRAYPYRPAHQLFWPATSSRRQLSEPHSAVTGISQRMLTLTLRQPERHELVPRTVHPCVPSRTGGGGRGGQREHLSFAQPPPGLDHHGRGRAQRLRRTHEGADRRGGAARAVA
ncbi:hypothetical protein G3260_000734 [Streptomyces albus]|nr:hypothetical protein G3260_000734 [Streptomyces albus]